MGVVKETVGFLTRLIVLAFLVGLAVGLYLGFRMGAAIDGPPVTPAVTAVDRV